MLQSFNMLYESAILFVISYGFLLEFVDSSNPICCNGTWTRWFDVDNPSGKGDYETLGSIRTWHPSEACEDPLAVDGRLLNGQSWTTSGEVVTVTTTSGLYCVNANQAAGKYCSDYKVRFCCKKNDSSSPIYCNGVWTRWFDGDDPSGKGDYETLDSIRVRYPGEACENPSAVDGRLLNGQSWTTSGEVLTVTTRGGLYCVNANQAAGKYCSDYKVSFCCKNTSDATPNPLSEILPWLNICAQSDDRGTQNCSQTNLLVHWSRTVIGLSYDYKLYIKDLLTNSTKKTSVEILYGIDPTIRISNLKSKYDVCSMTYEFYVSSDFSLSAEIIAGRIVGDLVSVITKVQHRYPSKTFEFVFFDAAGAD